jgi:Ribose/xylose/arabinose/galactoside ABC-type transport systems, permease components
MADTAAIKVAAKTNFRLGDHAPTYGAFAALVLLLSINIIFTPNFAAYDNFRNILVQVTPTMLVAVGMTFVIATGGIDLSVGSVMAIASAIAAILLDYGTAAAIVTALIAATAIGAFNGSMITWFKIQPIIITLALLISGRGIAQVISNGGQVVSFSNSSFEYLGQGFLLGIPFQIILLLVFILLAVFLLRSTLVGRYIVAVGGNEEAARLAGVKVNWTKISVYALSGLLAGLAGLVYTARLGASDASKVGEGIELDAIAATVVGGTPLTGGRATVIGTFIGALIMQIITTSFNMNGIKFSYSLVIKAAIILFAVYIQRPKVS